MDIYKPGQGDTKITEIYATYGYVMFLCQALEGLILQGIFVFGIFPSRKTDIETIVDSESIDAWDAFVDEQDRLINKMMGNLINNLKSTGEDSDLYQLLEEARQVRNYMAHQFYKDYIYKFYTENGQNEALAYLISSANIILKANHNLSSKVKVEMNKYGYTDDYIKNRVEELIAEETK